MNTDLHNTSSRNPIRYKSFHKKSNVIKLPEIVSPKNQKLKEQISLKKTESK
jgi:hypothetical protein